MKTKTDLVAMSNMQEASSYLDIYTGTSLQPYSLSARSVQPVDYKNSPLSLIDLQIFSPPTLREIVNAYLNSDDFRQACSNGRRTEITSTIKMHDFDNNSLDKRRIIVISRAREIFLDPTDELTWKFEYDKDKSSRLTQPDDNYVLVFDDTTGYPVKTGTREEAMEIFGNKIMKLYGKITDREAWHHGTERFVKIDFPDVEEGDLPVNEPPSYKCGDTPIINVSDGYLEQKSRRNFVRRCKRSEGITKAQYRFLLEQRAMLQEQQRKIDESLSGMRLLGE